MVCLDPYHVSDNGELLALKKERFSSKISKLLWNNTSGVGTDNIPLTDHHGWVAYILKYDLSLCILLY